MPRAYRRKAIDPAEDGTKARIIQASCEVLMADTGFAGFTLDAVARQANVARATVYYQFASKSGLLEAVFDGIAARSVAIPLEAVVSQAGQPGAVEGLVSAVAAFWTAERGVTRRFYGLAALDPEVRRSVAKRDTERRAAVRAIVAGHLKLKGRLSDDALEAGTAMASTLLRFETFDALAGEAALESAAPAISRLILLALE